MKIQVLSDQHIEHKANFGHFINRCVPSADTLVIAGDLCPHVDPTRYSYINQHILPKWKNTIIIPGNHEFYGSTKNDEWFESKKVVYEHHNGNKCYYLNNDTVEIEGVTFVCSTLWSEISPNNHITIQNGLNDYYSIKGNTVRDTNERFKANCKYLEETVDSLDSCVVVTHHVPSFSLVTERYRGHSLNEAFIADMDGFLDQYSHKIPLWICGHSHDFMDKMIYDTRCLRNPMGYPRERDADMDLVVEI